MKVALVHEFLTQIGGAEQVLFDFARLFPEATIFFLVADSKLIDRYLPGRDVRTSFIGKLPRFGASGHRSYLSLYPRAIESFNFDEYDLVLSDSSAFAKGVITHAPTTHISYIHTPTRYLWTETDSYLKDLNFGGLKSSLLKPLLGGLRRWDAAAALRPDYLIANSKNVADRIERYYHRSADEIIFPPVQTDRFHPSMKSGSYWLIVGRQEPYKRHDLAIAAATQLGISLKVVGSGSALDDLKRNAGSTVEFLGRVSEQDLPLLYEDAIGLLFPGEEDAGIAPLEAMAAGRPVLAYGKGGVLESVVPGKTGEFFENQTVASIVEALSQFKPDRYDSTSIRSYAMRYDISVFNERMLAAIERATRKVHKEQ